MRSIKDINKCEYSECDSKAISIVYSRDLECVVACCEKHEDIVEDEGHPEYWHDCPNCHCKMGIN